MTELLPNIFAVEVPESLSQIELYGTMDGVDEINGIVTILRQGQSPIFKTWHKSIPPGSYDILFTTKEATEDQAAQIVKREWDSEYQQWFYLTETGLTLDYRESLNFLLRSKGLNPDKNYLLIKKKV